MPAIRDFIVIGFIFCSVPFCLTSPFFGGLMWTWIAFMNPHRLAWGYARYQLSPAVLVAIPTLIGFVLSKEVKRLPRNYGAYALITLWVLMSLSTLGAHDSSAAMAAWSDRTKMFVMALVIVMLTTTHERLRMVLLVATLSIGFYGFKGGIFALVNGGRFLVHGPENTFIEDNNALALALNMILPTLVFLANDVSQRSLALALRVTAGLSIFAIISTHSRGGLLGLLTVVTLMFIKSGRKLTAVAVAAVGLFAVLAFVPEEWTERMETIESHSDGSAVSRLNAWTLAWRLALARPLLGWGPQAMEDDNLYDRYYPDSPTRNDVHSSYFQILSEGGFTTFFVWMSLLVWCFVALQRAGRSVRGSPDLQWIVHYAAALQVSLAAYAVSGMFLEMAYFDLIYHVVGGAIVVQHMARAAVRNSVRTAKATPLTALAPRTAPVPST